MRPHASSGAAGSSVASAASSSHTPSRRRRSGGRLRRARAVAGRSRRERSRCAAAGGAPSSPGRRGAPLRDRAPVALSSARPASAHRVTSAPGGEPKPPPLSAAARSAHGAAAPRDCAHMLSARQSGAWAPLVPAAAAAAVQRGERRVEDGRRRQLRVEHAHLVLDAQCPAPAPSTARTRPTRCGGSTFAALGLVRRALAAREAAAERVERRARKSRPVGGAHQLVVVQQQEALEDAERGVAGDRRAHVAADRRHIDGVGRVLVLHVPVDVGAG